MSDSTAFDTHYPTWQFHEVHAIVISAPPQRVYDAIRTVTADEIFLFRTLTAIRRCGRRTPESILNPAKDAPILDVATRTTFTLLADDPPREIVFGTVVIPPRRAVAGMNFLITPIDADADCCRLTTETRIFASDAKAACNFAVYWFVIRLGSGFIRRMWLRAIKKRAER